MSADPLTPWMRLNDSVCDPVAARLLPRDLAWRYGLAPLEIDHNRLVVASIDPQRDTLRAVELSIRHPLRAVGATWHEVRDAFARAYAEPVSIPQLDLGQILFRLGHLNETQLTQARQFDQPLEQMLLDRKWINESDLVEALALQANLPHLTLRWLTTQPTLAPLIPWETAHALQGVPLWWLADGLIVGTPTPNGALGWVDLAQRLHLPIWRVLCPRAEYQSQMKRTFLQGKVAPASDDTAPLGVLVRRGRLAPATLNTARALAQQTRRAVSDVLIEQGIVTSREWLGARGEALGMPIAPATPQSIPGDLRNILPATLARALAVLPLACNHTQKTLALGMTQPDDGVIQLVESLCGLRVVPRLIDAAELRTAQKRLYPISNQLSRMTPIPGLATLLATLGMVTPAQIAEVIEHGENDDAQIAASLKQRGYLSDGDLASAWSIGYGLPFVSLDHAHLDEAPVRRLPSDLLEHHAMLPLFTQDHALWVAVADARDASGMRALEAATSCRVYPVLAPRAVISAALKRIIGATTLQVNSDAHRLIDALMARGTLTQTQAWQALNLLVEKLSLDRAVVEASGLPSVQVAQELAACLNVPFISLQIREETTQAIDALGQPTSHVIVRDPVQNAIAQLIDLYTAQRLSALPIAATPHQVIVAFADPEFAAASAELEQRLGLPISPRLAARADLEEAIQRGLGHRNIGTRLLLAGIITRAQLNAALDLAHRSGVRLGRALVTHGFVAQDQLAHFLAEQAQLPFFDLRHATIDRAAAESLAQEVEREQGILPLAVDAHTVLLAMVDPLNEQARQIAAVALERTVRPVLVGEDDLENTLEQLYREDYLTRSVSELLQRTPDDSAFRVLSREQKIGLVILALVSALWLLLNLRGYIIFINALSTIFYLGFSAYKFYLAYRAMTHDLEVPVTEAEVAALQDRDLPVYTILVPVYREAQVLPGLLKAIAHLDYPVTKLDIKILMEAEDLETIQAFKALNLPAHFQGIVVPPAQPQTKPKACNYGLIHARGDYVVIYDAEDLPDADQLKRVLIAFSKSAPTVACVQSKLNYYNRTQNLLTSWFTVEYSMWFDLFLPGLDASHAPIPLGGTSNHFKRAVLVEAGAWDPYNVTEDADLGVRIFKRGYRTAIVDSTTYEEANSHVYNWIRQRSRWIKGYIQTWLVHMRDPIKLYKELGFTAFWGFQFVVGGTFFAALLNPVYWLLTTIWFMTHWGFIQEVFPSIVFYSGAVCLYLGNFAFTYLNVAGAMRRGYYDMVKYALLSPIYWALMSVGAWKGFWQLVSKPFYWEKTQHGLFQGEPRTEKAERLKDLV